MERGPAETPLFDAWLKAGEEAGYGRTDDVNGFQQEGFAAFDKNVHRAGACRLPVPTCTPCSSSGAI